MQNSEKQEKYQALSKEYEKLHSIITETKSSKVFSKKNQEKLSTVKEGIVKATLDVVCKDTVVSADNIKSSYEVSLKKIKETKEAVDRALKTILSKSKTNLVS